MKLPPLQILVDSIRFLFGRFPTFLRLAALPTLLLGLAFMMPKILVFMMPKILASSGGISSTEPLFVAFSSILIIAYVLLLICFTTAWHRVAIEGRSKLRLGRSEWRYLGYGLLLLIGLLMAQFVGVSLAGAVPVMAGKVAIALAPLLLMFFLVVRVMLVLPAGAAGQASSLIDAWDLTRGNTLRLIGLFAVILVSWWLLASIGQMLAMAVDISSPWRPAIRAANMIVGMLYWGLIVTAMSLCHRRLASPP